MANPFPVQLEFDFGQDMVKSVSIHNRRYLGNKFKLQGFIQSVIDQCCTDWTSFFDVFAGTGAVAALFPDKRLVTNDILYCNHVCHVAWFGAQEVRNETVCGLISKFNPVQPTLDNYFSDNFQGTYFNQDTCRKIGYIREAIEFEFVSGTINKRERAVLISSLLYAMDKIARTCGHYDAFRKLSEAEARLRDQEILELRVPQIFNGNNAQNQCFCMDSNELASQVAADVAYLDPPYNSRQYCDAYHLLENVARWEKPEVSGIARKMDRTRMKSDYCTQKAPEAFQALVSKLNCRYIIVSYNNMGNKGDGRSNAKITDTQIVDALAVRGEVQVFSESHKMFSAGKSSYSDNEERLFVVAVR